MDVLGGAATLVTLTGVVLASVKAAHHVLSAAKDGPRVVQSLCDELEHIRLLLEYLSKLSLEDESEMRELANQISRLSDDIAKFESELGRPTRSSTSSRRSRLWRRIKMSLKEKDLRQMQDVINQHLLILDVRLNALQLAKLTGNTTQPSGIITPLQQVEDDDTASDPSRTSRLHQTSTDTIVVDGDTLQPASSDTPELAGVLGELIQLVAHRERTIDSEHAIQMIRSLEVLIKCAQRSENRPSSRGATTDVISEPESVTAELRLAFSVLSSAPSVYVNLHGFIDTTPQAPIAKQYRKRKTIDLGDVTLTVFGAKRQMRHSQQLLQHNKTPNDMTNGAIKSDKQIMASERFVMLIFKLESSRRMIEVSVYQGTSLSDSFISMPPRISIINIRSRDSLVFRLASRGNVVELEALISQGGASLRDHDTRGWSLLHMLIYLINHGADLHAEDHRGWSVSSMAYGEAFDRQCANDLGSFFGDLWDAALDFCDHDILQFRKHHPRQANYCGGYNRADFEELWEGRAQRCPYWNDLPWPQADSEGRPQDNGRQKRCRCPWVEKHGMSQIYGLGGSESDSDSDEDEDNGHDNHDHEQSVDPGP
ncbi:hypothetical protein G7Z17_g9256 [Cylindrodendrum hubeiense]|uniref:Azaphilone pigments biosynthesis cluster protein L N-terminal domain-containing protein n=1 Tax=Cylindrodendrum hubeiense TaxID=595255 RepID=A0A9P5H9K8_9HYPO|nr:hypothetical protein G7Z17_g9256 [Cylindrodendrum hubeiense]